MRAIALATLLFIANAAWAQERGGYIGASLGLSSAPTVCEEDLVRRCEGNAAALRGFAGYAFNHYFAVEAGFNAISSAGANAGFDLSAIGSVPLAERVALYGRFGAYTGESTDGHNSRSYTDVTFGFGLRFDVSAQNAWRVDFQHFEGGDSIDVISVGLLYRF